MQGARAVCERGLKAMSFREEQERFNVWVSLMNLEHKYGSRSTLKAVSERACKNSNPKKVYLHMAEVILIVFFIAVSRGASERQQGAAALCCKCCVACFILVLFN